MPNVFTAKAACSFSRALNDSLRSCRIALLFCLPVLELGLEWLDGFHEVLIYPAPFVVDDEWEDDIGLVHNQRIVQSGQSWQQGPIVLNWLDIQDSFDASGFNLIIHEVAHKLDTRNGDRASGVPFIPLREVAGWEHDLHAAMNNIQEEIELVGENAASIDAYAASDPAECFAVLSEYFFSAPELFAPRFPSLWSEEPNSKNSLFSAMSLTLVEHCFLTDSGF